MKQLSLVVTVLLSLTLIGQIPVTPIICGNDIFSQLIREQYPGLDAAFNSTFEQVKSGNGRRSLEPLTINVVVHIVWKEDAENLHDSIVFNQLQILNSDFNRLNADTGNLRDLFKSVAGSADIHFELTEIVRVQTDQEFVVDLLSTNLLAEVKHSLDGGSDAWNTEHYLNLWVCKIQPIEIFGIEVGQILGFAFPPNGLSNWPPDVSAPSPEEDGVVIDFRVFGSNNPNMIEIPGEGGTLPVKGRTPVHEVGHYLGLRHIWGDGGILGPNDCNQSDGIADTPFADAQSAFDCDTSKNTCDVIEKHYNADVPDLIENYMDYASEACMNMFTQGQVELMRSVVLGPRSGLLLPPAFVAVVKEPVVFTLIPNPAREGVEIVMDTDRESSILVKVINANGVCTMSDLIRTPNRVVLETHTMASGLYFVEIQTATAFGVQRLIVH